MTIDHHDGTGCDAFADALSPYLEGELDPSTGSGQTATSRARVEAHAAACAECGALLADLRRISAEAAALPMLEPSHDLWQGIAARIEAPVIPLGASSDLAAPRSRLARRWRPGVAAAALVLMTAGVTYVATRASLRSEPVGAPAPIAQGPAPAPAEDASPSMTELVQRQARLAQADSLQAIERGDQSPVRPRPGPERSTPSLLVSSADAAASSVDSLYGQEIARLRTLIARRSASLDPATVAIIERNLGIIDSAIVRSRAALERDPASGFLNEQLTSALERKVELLRTAATLPARS